MKKSSKILIVISLIILAFLIFQTAEAFTNQYSNFLQQAGEPGAGYPSSQRTDESFINTRIGQLVGVAVSFIGLLFLGLTVYSGIQWMTAGGNEEVVTKARKRVINGTIGVGLTLCAFLIANLYFSYFESRLLKQPPSPTAPTEPAGWTQYPCQFDSDCEDVPNPYNICGTKGFCVECETDGDCIGLEEQICDPDYGICITSPTVACNSIWLPSDCIFREGCIWVCASNQTHWYEGNCQEYNASTHPCGQCGEETPYCHNYGSGLYDCVECESSNECPTIVNTCDNTPPTPSFTCTFGR